MRIDFPLSSPSTTNPAPGRLASTIAASRPTLCLALLLTVVFSAQPSPAQPATVQPATVQPATVQSATEAEPTAYARGVAALRSGDLPAAESALRQAVAEHPSWYGAYVALGQTLAQLQRVDDALAALERADALSDAPETTLQRAELALALGRSADARRALAGLDVGLDAELDPALRFAKARLEGRIAYRDERLKEAATAWGRALALREDGALRHDRALVFSRLDQWSEAEADLEVATRLAPGDVDSARELVRVRGELLGRVDRDERPAACRRAWQAGRRLLELATPTETTRTAVARFAACADQPDAARALLGESKDLRAISEIAFAYASQSRWDEVLTTTRATLAGLDGAVETPLRQIYRVTALAHEALEHWDRAHELYRHAGFADDAHRVDTNRRREVAAREAAKTEAEIADLLRQLEEAAAELDGRSTG